MKKRPGSPPLPRRSRFRVGDVARVKNTGTTFPVTSVSEDGATLGGFRGGALVAGFCERVFVESFVRFGTVVPG